MCLYSVVNRESECVLTFDEPVSSACFTDIMGCRTAGDIKINGNRAEFAVSPFAVLNVKLKL